MDVVLSILILQGHSLKRLCGYYNLKHYQSFNPHFTRTLSETLIIHYQLSLWKNFQSSFYKDTLWNPGRAWMRRDVPDHFQSSFYKDTLWNDNKTLILIASSCFQSSFYKDTLWNCLLSVDPWREECFQSSFYKDTLWNCGSGTEP